RRAGEGAAESAEGKEVRREITGKYPRKRDSQHEMDEGYIESAVNLLEKDIQCLSTTHRMRKKSRAAQQFMNP
uniref:hypothetical protein n=1 Tax=Enterocloster clostridioformis TaxID=1531 RepID=UPI0025A60170